MPENEEPTLNESLEGVFRLLKRRRWWILIPMCCVVLATTIFVLRVPDRYTSEATLVLLPQQVSQRFVEPANNTLPSDIIQSVAREVLSRGRLIGIIDDFGLYAREKGHHTPEELAERMRDDLVIPDIPVSQAPGRESISFSIAFTGESPQLAQAVTSRLTSLFIEENVKTTGERAIRTSNFLGGRLEIAKKKLAEQEQRLEDFKARNASELPEQQQANLGTLTDLRMRLLNTAGRLSQAQLQRASLESSIAGNLALLQTERSSLLTRFTERNSEVVKKNQEIARTQRLLERLRAETPEVGKSLVTNIPDDPLIAQLRNQVDANAAEIVSLSKDEQKLQTEIAQYQGRLTLTPVRAQQLTAILRDYDLYKQDYIDLQNKQVQAQLTASAEDSQEGQQFRLVDPATLPVKPSSPKRFRISLGGFGGGFALGLVLAFFVDSRDRSFHVERELKQHFPVPLVVAVPLLLTPAEERSRGWRIALEWLAGSSATLAVILAEFYIYRHG